jgi:hypothetical protein
VTSTSPRPTCALCSCGWVAVAGWAGAAPPACAPGSGEAACLPLPPGGDPARPPPPPAPPAGQRDGPAGHLLHRRARPRHPHRHVGRHRLLQRQGAPLRDLLQHGLRVHPRRHTGPRDRVHRPRRRAPLGEARARLQAGACQVRGRRGARAGGVRARAWPPALLRPRAAGGPRPRAPAGPLAPRAFGPHARPAARPAAPAACTCAAATACSARSTPRRWRPSSTPRRSWPTPEAAPPPPVAAGASASACPEGRPWATQPRAGGGPPPPPPGVWLRARARPFGAAGARPMMALRRRRPMSPATGRGGTQEAAP